MNLTIKNDFACKDLEVGDLMYDALNDNMVEIVYVGNTIEIPLSLEELKKDIILKDEVKALLSNTLMIPFKVNQVVMKVIETERIFLLEVIGIKGKLPTLINGEDRFKHLIKFKKDNFIEFPHPLLNPDTPSPSNPYHYQ